MERGCAGGKSVAMCVVCDLQRTMFQPSLYVEETMTAYADGGLHSSIAIAHSSLSGQLQLLSQDEHMTRWLVRLQVSAHRNANNRQKHEEDTRGSGAAVTAGRKGAMIKPVQSHRAMPL